MQVIHFADQPLKTREVNHRDGTFRYKQLGEGTPGAPDNFNLRWVLSAPDFFSPRHHHNFDQVRIQMRGEFSFDADGLMTPGSVGFFPEGTLYGPQTSQDDTVQLVMQIGGASQSGYLSEQQRIDAVAALTHKGSFRGGRFYPTGSSEADSIDGFQAAWEEGTGRKMVYPPQRFARPVLCDPGAMDWLPESGHPGVHAKVMWNFGPRTCGLRLVRQEPGSTMEFAGALSLYLWEGSCAVRGAGHDAVLVNDDVAHLVAGETITSVARAAAQWIVFVRPVIKQ